MPSIVSQSTPVVRRTPRLNQDLLEIAMQRYERASTLLTSNRPVEDWGGDVAAVRAMLDRVLHHGHIAPVRSAQLPHESQCNFSST